VNTKPINEFVLIHFIKIYVTCRMVKEWDNKIVLNVNNVKTCCDPN